MKVAFTGKGGVGKTTLASLFIQALSSDQKEILAVDCDPDSNLARALGFNKEITPIAKMDEMINKRMGVEEGNKTFFKLNPKIDDIPDKFSYDAGNIKLIVMGVVDKGGAGCMCPENTFIKNLLGHLILKRDEHVVLDMEAGVEHFGRGTAASCDFVVAVIEPSLNSIQTAKNIAKVARDIGIKKVYCVANKIRKKQDTEFIEQELGNIKLIEKIDFDEKFLERDKKKDLFSVSKEVSSKVNNIKQFLEGKL